MQGCTSNAVKLLAPTPISIALTVGEWVVKDNKKLFVVEVEATGNTSESARREAFNRAVSKALGTLVVTDRQILNDRVTHDELLMYSAGYVEDFEIKAELKEGSLFKVVVIVWVSESRIAERLRSVSITKNTIRGDKLQQKIETYKNQAQVSDRLLVTLLEDFPYKSFKVMIHEYSSRIRDRKLEILVPYKISWNQPYLVALEEMLVLSREGADPLDWKYARLPSVISIKKTGDWFKTFAAYSGREKEVILYRYMVESKPVLRVKMRGVNEEIIYQECFEMPHLSGIFFGDSIGPGFYFNDNAFSPGGQFFAANTADASFAIFGDFEYKNTGIFIFDPDERILSRLAKIEMDIAKQSKC